MSQNEENQPGLASNEQLQEVKPNQDSQGYNLTSYLLQKSKNLTISMYKSSGMKITPLEKGAQMIDQYTQPLQQRCTNLLDSKIDQVMEQIPDERKKQATELFEQRKNQVVQVTKQATDMLGERRQQATEMYGQRRKQVEEMLCQRRKQVEEMLGERTKQATELYGQRRKQVEEMLGERRKQVEEMLGERKKQATEMYGQRRKQVEEMIGQRKKQVEEMLGERRKQATEMYGQRRKQVEEILGQRKKQVEEMLGVSTQQVTDHFETRRQQVNKLYEERRKQATEMYGQRRKQVEEMLGQRKKQVEEMLGVSTKQVTDHFETRRQQVNDLYEARRNQVSNKMTEMYKMYDQRKQHVAGLVEERRKQVTQMYGEGKKQVTEMYDLRKKQVADLLDKRRGQLTKMYDQRQKYLAWVQDIVQKRALALNEQKNVHLLMAKQWMSLSKIYENAPTLEQLKKQLEKVPYLNNHQEMIEANLDHFHAVATEQWSKFKECKNTKQRMLLTKQIISETVAKRFNLEKDFKLSEILRDITQRNVKNLHLVVSKNEYVQKVKAEVQKRREVADDMIGRVNASALVYYTFVEADLNKRRNRMRFQVKKRFSQLLSRVENKVDELVGAKAETEETTAKAEELVEQKNLTTRMSTLKDKLVQLNTVAMRKSMDYVQNSQVYNMVNSKLKEHKVSERACQTLALSQILAKDLFDFNTKVTDAVKAQLNNLRNNVKQLDPKSLSLENAKNLATRLYSIPLCYFDSVLKQVQSGQKEEKPVQDQIEYNEFVTGMQQESVETQ